MEPLAGRGVCLSMFLSFACSPPPQPPPEIPEQAPYEALRERIAADRAALVAGDAGRDVARSYLRRTIAEELVPAWIGTPWDFYGTAEMPNEGEIACGHFVGVILRDAGFVVDRLAVGRLPSELIIGLFAEPSERRRFRRRSSSDVAADLRDLRDGVYGVGLDSHAGLMLVDGGSLRFCHASYIADAVVCEDPAESPAFESKYRVIGPILTDRAVDRWLLGEAIEVPSGY